MKGEDEAVCEGSAIMCQKGPSAIRHSIHRRPPPGVLHFDGHAHVQIQVMSRQLVKLNKVRAFNFFHLCWW